MKVTLAAWKHLSEQKKPYLTFLKLFSANRQFPISSVRFISTTASCVCLRARWGFCRRTTLLTLQLSSRNQLTTMSKVGSVTARGRISHFQLFALSYNWCRLKCLLNRNTSFWAQYSHFFEPTVCVQQKIRVCNLRLSVWSCNRRVWKLFG